jgi:signal transduction histidine kinase
VSDGDATANPNAAMGRLLALVVHDLRNPVATLSANVSFVREVGASTDPDVLEALDDVELALAELMRGLDQLAWVGRWLAAQPAMEGGEGDVRPPVRSGVQRATAPSSDSRVDLLLPSEPLNVRVGGGALSRLVELLVRNALAHAKKEKVRVEARDGGDHAILEVMDDGVAIGVDLREAAFTMEGQQILKGRVDGRYSRAVGLLASRALADALGATLEADGTDGATVFRVRLSKL